MKSNYKKIIKNSVKAYKNRLGYNFLLLLAMMLIFAMGFMMIFTCCFAEQFHFDTISFSIVTALFWLFVVFPLYKSFFAVITTDYYFPKGNISVIPSWFANFVKAFAFPLNFGFRILLNGIIGASIAAGLYFGLKYLTEAIAYNLDENVRLVFDTVSKMVANGESQTAISSYYSTNIGYLSTLTDVLQIIGINLGIYYFLFVTGYYHVLISVILQGIGPKLPIRIYYKVIRNTEKESKIGSKKLYIQSNFVLFLAFILSNIAFNAIFYINGSNFAFSIAMSCFLSFIVLFVFVQLFIYNCLRISDILAPEARIEFSKQLLFDLKQLTPEQIKKAKITDIDKMKADFEKLRKELEDKLNDFTNDEDLNDLEDYLPDKDDDSNEDDKKDK